MLTLHCLCLQEAWTHLAKEQGSSIAFLDGALVPKGVASHLGLSVSPDTGVPEPHLVIGTRSGEVVVVDAVRHGLLLLRLPLFRWAGAWGLMCNRG
jgi:hypothetical protein